MPWKVIVKDKQYCVVKKSSGKVIPGGCHKTLKDANTHMKAVYANTQEERG